MSGGHPHVIILVEIAGWAGAALILGAYLLLSMGRLTGQSALYQGMNVVGAAMSRSPCPPDMAPQRGALRTCSFIVNGWWHGALPSAALNVIWMLIGGVALWRIRKRGSSTSAT